MRRLPPKEEIEQLNVFRWAQFFPIIRDNLIAIPNGGKRDKVTAAKLKATGVKAGVSDTFLALPMHGKAGLWVEIKRIGGKPTEKQIEWLERMRANGYAAEIAEGANAAIQLYLDYIANQKGATEAVLKRFCK